MTLMRVSIRRLRRSGNSIMYHVLSIKYLKRSLIFLITFLFIVISTAGVKAQENIPSAADSSKVSYQLSYPGLLPDHPLYFLKAARDRVMSFFISNPVKKAEFDLLQADKRIAASFLLVQKGGKITMAQSTFSKGENYFEEAINKARDAHSQGVNISELAKKLKEANLKHQEVLSDIEKKLSKKDKGKFATEHTRLTALEKKVKELAKEK